MYNDRIARLREFAFRHNVILLASSFHSMQSTLPLDDRSVPITLPPDVVAAIDIWIAVQPDPKPSRDAMVGYVMREWLTCMGLLPPQQAPRVVN